MTSTYIISNLEYSEYNDTISAEFYLAEQNNEEQNHDAFVYHVEYTYGLTSTISYHGAKDLDCDPLHFPRLLLAFCEAHAAAYEEQCAGDSPACVELESFTTQF